MDRLMMTALAIIVVAATAVGVNWAMHLGVPSTGSTESVLPAGSHHRDTVPSAVITINALPGHGDVG